MGKVMDYDMIPAGDGGGSRSYPFNKWYNGKTWRIHKHVDFDIELKSMRSRLQNEWTKRELPEDHDDFMVHYCVTKIMKDEDGPCIEFQAVKYDPDSEQGRDRLQFRRNLREQSKRRRSMNS